MDFRKKPVVIQAVQYVDDNLPEPMLAHLEGHPWRQDSDGIGVITLVGEMKASPGDWIIKGVADEFYPCKPEILEQTYVA